MFKLFPLSGFPPDSGNSLSFSGFDVTPADRGSPRVSVSPSDGETDAWPLGRGASEVTRILPPPSHSFKGDTCSSPADAERQRGKTTGQREKRIASIAAIASLNEYKFIALHGWNLF
jgi:hypothetical protein